MSNKPKTKTSQNPVESRRGTPYGSGVTTRKFFGKSKVETPESSSRSRSNSDFIISNASKIKVLSNTVKAAAERARESLNRFDELVNTSVENDTGDNKKGKNGTLYDEDDLQSVQTLTAQEILKLGKIDEIENTDIRKMHESAALNILRNGTIGTSITKKPNAAKINKAIPVIDYATVMSSKRGSEDIFSANITFTLESDLVENVKAIRVFRATKEVPESTRARPRLSRLGMDIIAAQTSRTRNKNHGKFANYQQQQLDSRGIKNALSDMTKIDEFTGNRNGLVTKEDYTGLQKIDVDRSSTDTDSVMLRSFLKDADNLDLDSSVVSNLKAMRNIQIQNPNLLIQPASTATVGSGVIERDAIGSLSDNQVRDARTPIKKSGLTKVRTNAGNYKEIAIIPISRIKNRNISGLIEFYYTDVTAVLGETYTYYITSIDNTTKESNRSRIVKVSIESVIPPAKPLRLTATQNGPIVTLSILPEKGFNIEKFEIYRKETNSNKVSIVPVEITVINGPSGFTTERASREPVGNGFLQIGEAQVINSAGSTFIDRTVVEGKKYDYRVYSVDIYGNKSQHPKTSTMFVNERSTRSTDLRKPSTLAEIDSKSKKIKLTIDSSDDRIIGFFVTRKNHTIKERAFTTPSQQSHIKLGVTSSKAAEGIVFRDATWNGFIRNEGKQIIFVDDTAKIDSVYQYCIQGVDRFGMKSSCDITQHIFISRRPIVEAPVNVASAIDGEVFRISWEDSNLDIDPQDKIGNRDDLDATSKRTLFQVERKKSTEEHWTQFPMTDEVFIDDKIGAPGEVSPSYRPDYLEIDTEYTYRVAVFQTGGFISNFSDPIDVDTFIQVSRPTNFRVKTCDAKCEPFFIALNWDTPPNSGTVDKWIIERAEVNNFAAATLNLTNVKSITNLEFKRLNDVQKESSRSRSRVDDSRDNLDDEARRNRVLASSHNFIDDNVEFGNTYFYRIRASGLDGRSESLPITRGIKITDPAFDRKLNSLITQAERNSLSKSNEPLRLKVDLRAYGNRKSKKGI